MLLVKNQKITVKWITKDRKHYEDRGYTYTKHLDDFIVDVLDLKEGSGIRVDVICDYCFDPFKKRYCAYIENKKKTIKKDCCSKTECKSKKIKEVSFSLYGVENVFQSEEIKKKSKSTLLEKFGVTNISQNNEVKEKSNKKNSLSTEEMIKYITLNSACMVITTNQFFAKDKIELQCECGNKFITTFHRFKSYKKQCDECGYKDSRGENHHSWKGGITSEEKMLRKSKEYLDWRESVFIRDIYTCQCCLKLGWQLNAHHIESFSDNFDLRTEINNGITLCEDCHSVQIAGSFHSIYGTTNFTKSDFIEYFINKRMNLGLDCGLPIILK